MKRESGSTTLLFSEGKWGKMRKAEERIRELARQVAGPLGCSVEEVKLTGSGRRYVLRVILDKEGGVSLRDCELVSRDVGAMLDVENIIPGPYNLEVSSPGLDRPLKKAADYKKYAGRLVRVVTNKDIDRQRFFVGRLVEASDEDFLINIEGKTMRIPYEAVSKANLEVEVQ